MSGHRRGDKVNGGSDPDLYAELEVDRNCSQEELRRQYKRLAMRFHPDKNVDNREEAEQRFQRISAAYEILSDPAKRRAYDQGGADAVRAMDGGSAGGGFDPFGFGFAASDPFDLFADFFGTRSRGRRGRGFGFFDLDNDGFFGSAFSDDFWSQTPTEGGAYTSRSVTEQTVVRDGRQVTKRVTTTQGADGTKQTVEEEWINGEKTSTNTIGGSTVPAIENTAAKRTGQRNAKDKPGTLAARR